jgi:hypothetical protein
MTRLVERVLRHLENVGEITSGWTARCPAHDDRLNSLSIGEGEDGKVLVHCHAGCAFEEVIAAMGLRVRDLFPPRRGS